MNWKRGLIRVWVFLTALWLLLVVPFSAIIVGSDPDAIWWAVAIVGGTLVVAFLIGALGYWAARGFKG